MNIINLKNIREAVAIFFIALTVLAFNSAARASSRNGGGSAEILPPDLPAECSSIEVEAGNEVAFHAYAIGVQIYRWNGSAWIFVAPEAKLYANAGFNGNIGSHYGGPTWESKSGSKVVAARVQNTGCTPDATAIPWLKLKTVSTDGPGIFKKVSYIQRVATSGGIAPTAPGMIVGEEKRVPYTAEYYFYRSADQD